MRALTFRLSESDIDLLKLVAERRGTSQADAIRFCIGRGADAIRGEGGGEAPPVGGVAVSALADQLAAKDRQIEAKDEQISVLARALESASETARAAQDTARAAQVLHAADKPELALEASGGGKGRWRRLVEAWRGPTP